MFKALVPVVCGEGINSYEPVMVNGVDQFASVAKAREVIQRNYGRGIVTTTDGRYVEHV